MGKLDAVASGKRSQQLEVTAMQEETRKLDNELLGKTRVKDVLASQLVDAQAEVQAVCYTCLLPDIVSAVQ